MAFSIGENACFRFTSDAYGRPEPCEAPVGYRGQFKDATGRWWDVFACDRHASELGVRQRYEQI
jgi:hypothetical protein